MHELTAQQILEVLRQIAADVAVIRSHNEVLVAVPNDEEMPAWLRNTLFNGPASQASAPASSEEAAQHAPEPSPREEP